MGHKTQKDRSAYAIAERGAAYAIAAQPKKKLRRGGDDEVDVVGIED